MPGLHYNRALYLRYLSTTISNALQPATGPIHTRSNRRDFTVTGPVMRSSLSAVVLVLALVDGRYASYLLGYGADLA